MTDLDNNQLKAPANATTRILIGVVSGVVLVAGSVFGVIYHKKHQHSVSISIGGGPSVSSVPGSGKTTDQYVRDQQKQNTNLLNKAAALGTSAVPTITRSSFIGSPEAFLDAAAAPKTCPAANAHVTVVRDPASCTVANLIMARQAGVHASELLCQGCACPVLKQAGYTVGELKEAGFSAKVLRQCGYSLKDLMAAGFSAKDLLNAGFAAKKLKAAGFSAAQLMAAGVSAQALKAAGFSAAALKAAGFSAHDLASAGFSAKALKSAGFYKKNALLNHSSKACSVVALKKARAAGASALELKNKGCSAAALKAAGYTAAELKQAGYAAKDLLNAGYSVAALKAAGFSVKELKDAGVSAAALKAAGFSANALKAAGFSAKDLEKAGFSAKALKAAGFSAKALKAAGYSAGDLHAAGFTAKDLLKAGYSPKQLRKAGVSAQELKMAGLTPDQLKAAGYTNGDLLRSGFTPSDIDGSHATVDNSCSMAHITAERRAGFSASKIKAQGCSADAMAKSGFSAGQLAAAGFSNAVLKAAGVLHKTALSDSPSSANPCAPNALRKARNAGVSAITIVSRGCSVNAMRAAGFDNAELASAGFSPAQLDAAAEANGDSGMSANTLSLPSQTGPKSRAAARAAALRKIQQVEQQQMDAAQAQQELAVAQAQMQGQAQGILSGWSAISAQSYQTVNTPTKTPSAAAVAAAAAAKTAASGPVVKAGDVMFAVLDVSINTDENSPIMANIVSGPFTGAKLIGSFARENDAVEIKFNTISIKGYPHSIPFSAVAIDANNAHSLVSGHVNHHYMLRYGSLFASSFLSGFSKALSSAKELCFVGGRCIGASDSSKVTTKQQLEMGAGQVGTQYASTMSSNFHRDPTVKIAQGTGIGVLITSDMTLPVQLKPLFDKYNKMENSNNA